MAGAADEDVTAGDDPYLDPTSGVLRNRLGLTDPVELLQAEADLSFLRITELGVSTLEGGYDLAHLRDFHRHVFGDVYDWAGELRTVDIVRTHLFARAQFLEQAATGVFNGVARDGWLRGLDRDAFVARLAHHLAEVNALHPFREGNGRAQRAFFSQLARDAGYRIAWAGMDPAENIVASKAGLAGDLAPLTVMLERIIEA